MPSSPTPTTPTPGDSSKTTIAAVETGSPPPTLTSPRAVESLGNLEQAAGGRQGLIDTIIVAPRNPKEEHFLRILADPMRVQDSLARICRDAGLKPNEMLDLWRKGSFALASSIAVGKAARAIPAVVDDLAQKSVDHFVSCRRCKGSGEITVKVPPLKEGDDWSTKQEECGSCFGSGQILRESDLSRQQALLDMLNLGRKTGPSTQIINANAQNVGGDIGSLFSRFVKASDADAYDVDPTVLDAEVVPERAEAPRES